MLVKLCKKAQLAVGTNNYKDAHSLAHRVPGVDRKKKRSVRRPAQS
jgi:hypothetical protein